MNSTTLNVPYHYTPITPSNLTDFPSLTRGIYVASEGDISVVRYDGTVVTFSNVAAGSVLPVSARRVNASGTTASGLCALFGRLERDVPFTPNTFSPLDLSPVLWLDAADTATITESGGAVSQWDDKSGNGNHVTQGTAAAQPTTGTRTINGVNVLNFDGVNDVLSNSLVTTQPTTSFVVGQFDSIGARDGLIGNSSAAIYQYDGGQLRAFYNAVLATATGLVGGAQVFTVTANSTSSVIRIDGVQRTAGNAGTNGYSAAFNVGLSYGYLDGAISEIIIVDGTLTAGEIADTEAYLAAKWGITL